MQLSPAQELSLEGWRESEIIQISVFFEELFQNLEKKVPWISRFTFFLLKGIQRGTQGLPKSMKSRMKIVSKIRSVSLWLPDPSQNGSRGPKGGQKWTKIDDFVIGFL